jgi:hypothetical protein
LKALAFIVAITALDAVMVGWTWAEERLHFFRPRAGALPSNPASPESLGCGAVTRLPLASEETETP